jgi:hypothetical protein
VVLLQSGPRDAAIATTIVDGDPGATGAIAHAKVFSHGACDPIRMKYAHGIAAKRHADAVRAWKLRKRAGG